MDDTAKQSTWAFGLVAVTLILGLAASIVIPNLMNAINRGKQRRTMADMRKIAENIAEYYDNFKSFPVAESKSISDMQNEFARAHIYNLPLKDGWGGEFIYMSDGKIAYTIVSTGKDRKLDQLTFYHGATPEFSNDLVFSNGWFISFPEGVLF